MGKRFVLAVILAAIVCFAACTDAYQTEATVTGKHYDAAYSYVQMIPVCNGRTTTVIPVTQYVPEYWVLSVSWMREGRQATHDLAVDETTYHQLAVGDRVPLTVGWRVEITER